MSILDKFRKNDGEDRQDQTRKIKTVTREGGKTGGNLGRRFLRRILSRYRGAFTRRTTPPHMALAVATTSFKIAIAFLVVLCFVVGGSLLGVANAYINTTPDLDIAKLTDTNLSSYIYDCNGDLVTMYSGIENRSWATIEEIPEMLENAFIATEDARFYSHNGVDLKRIVGAFLGNFTSGGTQGASTITQQLIKNRMLTAERSYKRKIQEAYLAIMLEQTYEKELILEAYLNDINLAQSNYGVKAAAKDYFNKELDELTIRECAMLAGITQNPSKYDPRRNYYIRNMPEVTDTRTDVVLSRMRDNGFITNEEYEAALAEPLNIQEVSVGSGMYDMPYFVEYAIYDVINKLLDARGLENTTANRAKIDEELRTGGYHIYLTVDPEVQKAMEETIYNWNKYPSLMNSKDKVIKYMNADGTYTEVVQPQISATTLDWSTGELRGIVGGRTAPTGKKQMNRAYMSSQPIGSTMKPLGVYGPAIDNMNYGAGSIVWNVQGAIDGWDSAKGYPASGKPYAPVTFRQSIQSSLNISTARVLMEMSGNNGIEVSLGYLEKMGVNTEKLNGTGAGIALGTSGMTTIEMAVAFGSVANKGEYISPISFTEIKDDNGNVILDARTSQEKHTVFKPGTAWLLIDMMKDVISSGTGTSGRVSGYTTAGKTGTNDNYRGVTFCGINAYYTSAIWVGHDNYKPLRYAYGGSTCAPIYKAYMTNILKTKKLPNRDIITDSPSSLGLKRYTVCGVSGMAVTDACKHDASEIKTVTDWFPKEFNPAPCTMHRMTTVCGETGKMATEFCPVKEEKAYVVIDPNTSLAKCKKETLDEIFKVYSIGEDTMVSEPCDVHNEEWNNQNLSRTAAVNNANSTISWCKGQMNSLGDRLTDAQKNELNQLMMGLEALIADAGSTAEAINAANNNLRNTATGIFASAPPAGPDDGNE